MKLKTLLLLCDAYARMGDAVQRQLVSVVTNFASMEDKNDNALRRGKDFLEAVLKASASGADEELWGEADSWCDEIADHLNLQEMAKDVVRCVRCNEEFPAGLVDQRTKIPVCEACEEAHPDPLLKYEPKS